MEQYLNNVTVGDPWPLPMIVDLFGSFPEANIFLALDILISFVLAIIAIISARCTKSRTRTQMYLSVILAKRVVYCLVLQTRWFMRIWKKCH